MHRNAGRPGHAHRRPPPAPGHAHRLQARSHRPRHLAGRPRSSYTMPLTRRMWQLWPASFAGCAFRRAPTAPVSGLGPWQRVQRTGTSARSFATMPDSQGPVPIPWRPVRSEAGAAQPAPRVRVVACGEGRATLVVIREGVRVTLRHASFVGTRVTLRALLSEVSSPQCAPAASLTRVARLLQSRACVSRTPSRDRRVNRPSAPARRSALCPAWAGRTERRCDTAGRPRTAP